MKQILFTLLLFCTVGLFSCRRDKNEPDIKQFDDQEMLKYIASHNLTGMQRDLTTGDTTGMYYKILTPGTGKQINYPDSVSLVFTVTSFDGKFIAVDTIANHVENFLGHITQNNLPLGVELGLLNILKNKGGRMRLLVPSHLGYGINGFGTGSSSSNNRVAGNQGLDYYLNLVDNQAAYDAQCIKSYISANNLTGFNQITTGPGKGVWYKITQAGSGAAITPTSLVTIQYTGTLFNGFVTSDAYNAVDGTGTVVDLGNDTRTGLVAALQTTLPGSKLTILVPSTLAYGPNAYSDTTIPVNSCIKYDINVISSQ